MDEAITNITFGVEVECYMPPGMTHAQLAAHLTEAGLPATYEGYNHAPRDHWKVVTDGSLNDYVRGAEVVSPVLKGEAGIEAVRAACRKMRAIGCDAPDTRCGFHVHVGARDLTPDAVKALIRLYHDHEAAIEAALAPSRRGTRNMNYIKPTTYTERLHHARTMEEIRRSYGAHLSFGDRRYRKLNIESFWRHGTVEFRQHQGTVSAERATRWVTFCLRMVAQAKKMTASAPSSRAATTGTTARRAPFRFSQVGVPVGSVLETAIPGAAAASMATVVDDRHIRFRGERTNLSAAALILARESGRRWPTIQGPLYWRVAGSTMTLAEMRGGATTSAQPAIPYAPAPDLDGLLAMIGAADDEHSYFARRVRRFS